MRIRRRGKRPVKPKRQHRINEEIRAPRVRLVEGGESRVIPIEEALKKAQEEGLDLVEIAKDEEGNPVVKIVDYGKFRFELSKKEKEKKKKQKSSQLKEIKLSPRISIGDFERKCQNAREFLEEGDTVKVNMFFRGRELAHTEIGLEKMKEFYRKLEDIALLDKEPKLEGRIMSMLLRPKKQKS